jgi:hypothetical protein
MYAGDANYYSACQHITWYWTDGSSVGQDWSNWASGHSPNHYENDKLNMITDVHVGTWQRAGDDGVYGALCELRDEQEADNFATLLNGLASGTWVAVAAHEAAGYGMTSNAYSALSSLVSGASSQYSTYLTHYERDSTGTSMLCDQSVGNRFAFALIVLKGSAGSNFYEGTGCNSASAAIETSKPFLVWSEEPVESKVFDSYTAIRFYCSTTSTDMWAGLQTSAQRGTTTFEYSWKCSSSSTLEACVASTCTTIGGGFTTSQLLEIRIGLTDVEYWRAGSILQTTSPAPNSTLNFAAYWSAARTSTIGSALTEYGRPPWHVIAKYFSKGNMSTGPLPDCTLGDQCVQYDHTVYDLGKPQEEDSYVTEGLYGLCWTHGERPDGIIIPYLDPTDYGVALGEFYVIPNDRFFTWTECTLGLTCKLYLGAADLRPVNSLRIWAQGKCGLGTEFDPMNDATIDPPLDIIASTIFPDNEAPYTGYFLGTPFVRATGNFSLCWAEEATSDISYENDKGTFWINGPDPLSATVVCTFGIPCGFQLAGQKISSSNRVRIIQTSDRCGDNVGNPLHFTGLYELSSPSQSSVLVGGVVVPITEGEAFNYSLSTGTAGPVGVPYFMCWAHDPGTGVNTLWNVHIGEMIAVGPAANDHTCYLATPCVLTIGGFNVSENSSLRIYPEYKACGDTVLASELTFQNFSNPALTVSLKRDGNSSNHSVIRDGEPLFNLTAEHSGPVGDYRLCWSHDPLAAGANYNTPAGTLFLAGPVVQDYACTLGTTCLLYLQGVGVGPGNGIRIVALNSDCRSGAPAGNFSTLRTERLLETMPPYDVYDLGEEVVGPPGYWTLCWGHEPAASSGYLLNVGVFTMNGPEPKNHTCTLGMRCYLTYAGVGLNVYNRIILYRTTTRCGDGDIAAYDYPGLEHTVTVSPSELPGHSASQLKRYDLAMAKTGTPTADAYRICWVNQAAQTEDYLVDLWYLTITGPSTRDLSCTLGYPCELTLSGHALQNTSRVRIISLPATLRSGLKNE